jgi:hypothetical protein
MGSENALGPHIFDRVEHRLTKPSHPKPSHPRTNGQAERMNRTIKDAAIKLFHAPDIESLKAHVPGFVAAYNFAKHLKTLRWKTPFDAMAPAWTTDFSIFKINPQSSKSICAASFREQTPHEAEHWGR